MTPDCRTCGACCAAGMTVPVAAEDVAPKYLTRSIRRLVGFASWEGDDGTRMMAQKDGRCCALRGDVGAAVHCSIYARRPAVCREFVRGSAECLTAIASVFTGEAEFSRGGSE